MMTCTECNAAKPEDDFYLQTYQTKNGPKTCRTKKCKPCCISYQRGLVKENETHYQEYRRKYNKKNTRTGTGKKKLMREWLKELKGCPCLDCGGLFPPECMDFDHRDRSQKKRNIASMIGICQSKATILAEIAKCDLVCANCHRIRTAKQLNWS